VLGALVLVAPRATLSLWDLVIVVALSFGGHILINHSAYWLGIRDVKWWWVRRRTSEDRAFVGALSLGGSAPFRLSGLEY
jgi:hypothetical protein